MAFLLSRERSELAAVSFSPLKALMNWLNRAANAHKKHKAMHALLSMEEFRLEDLGICRQDILDALGNGKSLSNRRAERSRATPWSM